MKKRIPRLKLRNKIERSNLMKKDVAKWLGMSSQQMTHIISGRKQYLNYNIVDGICAILCCEPWQILRKHELDQYEWDTLDFDDDTKEER